MMEDATCGGGDRLISKMASVRGIESALVWASVSGPVRLPGERQHPTGAGSVPNPFELIGCDEGSARRPANSAAEGRAMRDAAIVETGALAKERMPVSRDGVLEGIMVWPRCIAATPQGPRSRTRAEPTRHGRTVLARGFSALSWQELIHQVSQS